MWLSDQHRPALANGHGDLKEIPDLISIFDPGPGYLCIWPVMIWRWLPGMDGRIDAWALETISSSPLDPENRSSSFTF
jgi:hypothetical protein